jgi:hypothetical protein
MVPSITLKDGSNVKYLLKSFQAAALKPPEKKESQKSKSHRTRFRN